ncbi:MAG: beta-hydroxyacyl-ACP dehydratase [Firmicutes bacterium]|nr:beta-hydroxyacyl-ACP dehydratase [Bacillota bacterium]
MTQEEIKNILPHRNSMLLLDELYREDDTAHGVKYIRGDEWFLDGHFPDSPVVPGVILCEILAQSACVLLAGEGESGIGEDKIPMYTGLNNVKFKSPVLPGDKFETKCRITRSRPPFYFAEGQGYVGERLCVKAEFSFAVTERKF